MREAFVGFDSAWTDGNRGGIAWATFEQGHLLALPAPEPVRFEDAARIIERLRDECQYVLVAIDQPTLVPNETGMRPVERVAASLVSKLHSGVQPAYRGAEKREMFGSDAPIWRFLDRIGARENPPAARTATHGLHLMEVYPVLALPALEPALALPALEPALALPALEPEIIKRKCAARYNPKNKNFSLSDWKLVASTVQRHAGSLRLAPLSRWAGEAARLAAPAKSDQDRLDAALCLLVALYWRREPRDRFVVIGDSRTGYMVTPVSPASREILERAAAKRDVPIDGPWPRDVERSPDDTPGDELRRSQGPAPAVRNTSSESGGAEYPCPIPGCSKIFHRSRGGWDTHVGSLRIHPVWHPDVSNPEERKRIFKYEYGYWFPRGSY